MSSDWITSSFLAKWPLKPRGFPHLLFPSPSPFPLSQPSFSRSFKPTFPWFRWYWNTSSCFFALFGATSCLHHGLNTNDKCKILDCQILKKKLRSSWTQNWSTYTVCNLFFIFDDSLSSTSSFWYQDNQSKYLALLFRSLFQIMKARPGALEHELVLCIFDCFNKTIAFEQVNLEISLMATL